jgi:hypothetical protein
MVLLIFKGLSVSEGLFYIHHNIVKGFRNETEAKPKSKKGKKKHSIRSTHCHLGKASALTYGNTILALHHDQKRLSKALF